MTGGGDSSATSEIGRDLMNTTTIQTVSEIYGKYELFNIKVI